MKMPDLAILTRWIHCQGPISPTFSDIIFLFITITLASGFVALDLFNKSGKKVTMSHKSKFPSIAMIGCGSMGGGLALLFAENGVDVSLSDSSEETMDAIIEKAEKAGYHNRVTKYKDYDALCSSLSQPRMLVFSLPHGSVGDKVLDGLMPYLSRGDIILDCGNEHWENTERRQKKAKPAGIHYIGCGVSGGYQAARAGPSMCPGGDEIALNEAMPLLENIAAKDRDGRPCVGYIGKGGAGHYVKMMHNAIEHGMMAALCEAWGILRMLGLTYEEIGKTFSEWNESGELQGTFLVAIGADLSHKRESDDKGNLVISSVLDKVVQDVTGEEGTGIWGNTEAIETHVPAFTLNTSHALRLASAYRGDRERANSVSGGGFPPQKLSPSNREEFIEDLRKATYAGCLASYIQGLNVISRASQQHGWNINYANVWKIWRAGCIIQSDYISEKILGPVLLSNPSPEDINLVFNPRTMDDVRKTYPSLRRVVAAAVETDQVVPALSSTLEYFKIVTGTNLSTSFYEAELDYFGNHMFDKKGEKGTDQASEGKHHFEWKPARSQAEEYKKGPKL